MKTAKITLFFETAVVPNPNPLPMLNTPAMERDTKVSPMANVYRATPPAKLRELVGDSVPEISPSTNLITINSNSSNWCSPCCLWK